MKTAVSYSSVCTQYDRLRELSRKAAHDSIPDVVTNKDGMAILKSTVSLGGLDFLAYKTLEEWEQSGERIAQWDWEAVRKSYRNHPKRFELSIWHKDSTLCGASIGRPTYSGNKLRLDFIEANPLGSPLNGLITDIILVSSRVYARAIGASQLRIMHPVNERVRDHYMSKGDFSYNEKGNFCYQEL